MRGEEEIFADLQTVCHFPGYVQPSLLCFRDNFIRFRQELKIKDMDHMFSRARLIRTEISTLIGLLITKPIDFSHPGLGML